jgi:hypothetical protein
MTVNENTKKVTRSFIDPHGPSPAYLNHQQANILSIPLSAVLTKEDLRTATG